MGARFGVIVLAAGQSRRMGAPKPLLELGGRTLIEIVLDNPFLSNAGVQTVVVTGHESQALQARIGHSVPSVYNPHYEAGRMSSVQCGLAALETETGGAFVWPVDCPLVPEAVFHRLSEAFRDAERICIPTFEGRRGHPPLIGSAHFADILAYGPGHPLRDHYKSRAGSIIHVETGTETVLHNINTPEDYRRIQSHFGETQGDAS